MNRIPTFWLAVIAVALFAAAFVVSAVYGEDDTPARSQPSVHYGNPYECRRHALIADQIADDGKISFWEEVGIRERCD